MVTQNSNNLKVTNNADGYDITGGTTERKLTVTGADVTLTGSGSNTYTFPASTDTLVGRASTDTLTNKTFDANGTGNSISNIDVEDLADGTDGELITWDSSGAPAVVAVGTANYVLTSNGPGAAPTFQAGGSGTVTSVAAGNGLDFTTITATGSVTMGTPGALDADTTNGVTTTSHTHTITTGISDNNIVQIDSASVADDEYARFTANGLESRSAAEVLSDIGALGNIVADTTPELGGELDAGANSIGFTAQTATGDGTTTIDWGNGNKFNFTFGAFNETFTFTAPSNPGNFVLKMVQDGTGSRTATWPATVKWPGGDAPTLSTAASSVDIVSFYYDGTNYYGVGSLDFS